MERIHDDAGTQPPTARRVVGSYSNYSQAQEAVDYLSDNGFAVEGISIVGEGLHYVERVTGRKGYGRAAWDSAVIGAFIGAVLGWLFGLFTLVDPLVNGLILALYGLVLGAVIGAVIGLIGHAMTGGRRDFSSVGGFEASRYDVMADEAVASDAERLLREAKTRR